MRLIFWWGVSSILVSLFVGAFMVRGRGAAGGRGGRRANANAEEGVGEVVDLRSPRAHEQTVVDLNRGDDAGSATTALPPAAPGT